MSPSFTLRGDREIRRLLESLSGRELQNRMRRATRAGAAVMRKELRSRAAGGDYPKTFQKIATRTSTRGGIRTQTGPTSPLLNIFEEGAKPHVIAPTAAGGIRSSRGGARSVVDSSSAGVLSNPEAHFFARGAVRHPGMAARPLIAPVFAATKDRAGDAAMDTLTDDLR